MIDYDQFGRAYKLQAGTLLIEGNRQSPSLRVEFNIERDKTTLPNNAEIRIYNLNEESRRKLEQTKDATCRLEAGYETNLGQIFFGVLRDVESRHDGVDWVTSLSAGDGEDTFTETTINKTFTKGTQLKAILKYMIGQLGLGEGNLKDVPDSAQSFTIGGSPKLKKAATFRGSLATELKLLTDSMGLEWSIQDGAFQILETGKGLKRGAPLISPETGLLTSPSVDKEGTITFQTLLLPDLFPGVPLELKSNEFEGVFVTTKTTHVGDFEATGAGWIVEVECEPAA